MSNRVQSGNYIKIDCQLTTNAYKGGEVMGITEPYGWIR